MKLESEKYSLTKKIDEFLVWNQIAPSEAFSGLSKH